jgi:hypothetical protein
MIREQNGKLVFSDGNPSFGPAVYRVRSGRQTGHVKQLILHNGDVLLRFAPWTAFSLYNSGGTDVEPDKKNTFRFRRQFPVAIRPGLSCTSLMHI